MGGGDVHLLHVTFTLPVGATLVGLLFDLVVVFALRIFGRVKPLDHLPS
jgi:hypothetical protein